MTPRDATPLYCPRCRALTPHRRVARYGFLGEVGATVDRCGPCGHEAARPEEHEEPPGDPPRPLLLDGRAAARWLEARWRYQRGLLTDEE